VAIEGAAAAMNRVGGSARFGGFAARPAANAENRGRPRPLYPATGSDNRRLVDDAK